MWNAPPTLGWISASGAKKLVMPARVVQASQAWSSVADHDLLVDRAFRRERGQRVPDAQCHEHQPKPCLTHSSSCETNQ